jgi:hypothetical protein
MSVAIVMAHLRQQQGHVALLLLLASLPSCRVRHCALHQRVRSCHCDLASAQQALK